MPEPIDTAAALRGLALPEPPRSGWPRLAASIARERRQRQRRWVLPLALAASLMLLMLRPATPPPASLPQAPLAEAAAEVAAGHDLAALQAESARLDAALFGHADSVDSAGGAALRVQIADRVAWIDALLAGAGSDDARLALWSERVLLLRELHRLQGRDSWLLAAAANASATPMVSL
jgi:hypothetical protein